MIMCPLIMKMIEDQQRRNNEKDPDEIIYADSDDDQKSDPDDDVIGRNKRILYYHNEDFPNFNHGLNHPMNSQGLAVCHSLIRSYELDNYFTTVKPPPATFEQMAAFHEPEYLNFLKTYSSKKKYNEAQLLQKFNVGKNCPVFDGVYDYCSLYTAGTIAGAKSINRGRSDIVINWSGGMHHAKKGKASGFCYVNDIVLGILELLKKHKRVLYIDIDLYHGDGVQQAFYDSTRVMTLSFHRFGGSFFPGTGMIDENGTGRGNNHSINVPFRAGMDDENYILLFKPIIRAAFENFDPNVIVFQSGAYSLGYDRIGNFNLTFDGHGECVRYVKSLGRPVMFLGGGGITLQSVARCRTYETAIIVGQDDIISNTIPKNTKYREYFSGEQYQLRPELPHRTINENPKPVLDLMRMKIIETLRNLDSAPTIKMHAELYNETNQVEHRYNCVFARKKTTIPCLTSLQIKKKCTKFIK